MLTVQKQSFWLKWFSYTNKRNLETSWNTINLEFHILFVFHESNDTKQLDMQSFHVYLQYG
jgi:hypothetical protein